MTAAFARLYNDEMHREWVNPTGGKIRECDSQGCGHFGARRAHSPHEAVDYVATPGQDVVAVTDGTIGKTGYPYHGNFNHRYISIGTSDGYYVRQLYVAPAQEIVKGVTVSAGQVIGTNQGLQTVHPGMTPHVHVDIRHNGQVVNPTTLIPLP